ncbi:hypothetical protein C5B89_13305 [Haloferax sp. Atlit-47N]|uniref:Uncharacterized protein n=1 Tax=Haloferax volcanii TaxID=2246 RepID=A0A558GB85_HALVO|nr:hypothetical protein [Haloferax sp. AS1]RDZ31133.1 hypothetical protein DEQ67_12405 [Haloferax sp. Atlit-48N]RDZ34391.1 hypothetical protein C5B88_16255 [Haloferax sp. Atlit-24N]RDZ38538.1 hypothetical protein C5B89_13305 [Haloferax sp. Atlit-47N]RLM36397.1 hypothetical protein DVK03_15175 [Haloferax sp. Atlit-109R]RLM41866.1 hypothetical protein DVK04_15195 [Haloferax sp. Atlit-105R]TVT95006.1 hypothetical protein FQA18_08895 [Haloferax volcanii]
MGRGRARRRVSATTPDPAPGATPNATPGATPATTPGTRIERGRRFFLLDELTTIRTDGRLAIFR